MADNPRLYVGGVPKQANREDFEGYFKSKGACDEIILMGSDPHRGFGFIQYSDPAVTQKVLEEKHSLKGIQMGVKVATKKETRLFLGGLQSTVTEQQVREVFAAYSTEKLQVFPERGIGFVTIIGSSDSVNQLLKTEHEIDGKKIRVTIANPRASDMNGRGGGRGGRGRGRGRGRGGRDRGGWNTYGYGAPPPYGGYGYGSGYNPYGPPSGGGFSGPSQGYGAPRGGYGAPPSRGGYDHRGGYGGGRGASSGGYQTSTPQFGYNQPAGGYGAPQQQGGARDSGYSTTYNAQYASVGGQHSQQYAPY